jgi:hypothetical protein
MTYEQLVKHFGSEAEASRALNIPQSTINPWSSNGIPHWRQSEIEYATDGKLRADKRRNGS